VGTLSNGLNRLTPSPAGGPFNDGPDSTNAPSDKSIRSLLAGRDGRIWVGAGDGILNQLEPETGRFRQLPPPDPVNAAGDPNRMSQGITAMVEDPGKSLWLGTEGGQLFRFDLRSETWKSYTLSTVPGGEKAAAPVASLWVGDGLIWVGTQQNGLVRFDPASETFAQITEGDGLPGMNISGILEDGQGALWLSTENGLVQFTPETGKPLVFHTADGLPADSFVDGAAFRSPGGELFFGSAAGLLAFFPESVRPNPYVPPVVITDFQLLYEAVPPGPASPWRRTTQGDEIHLGYSQNVFTIEYAALDFANPGANQYTYQLVGFDPDWIEAGPRRQASYTSLEPGDYVFRVRGSNNAGVWNEAGVSIPVVIQPPFWLTGWFRLLAVGLVLAMVTSGVGLRLRAVNRQKRELVRQVEERWLN
jgi:streptogramin lyase